MDNYSYDLEVGLGYSKRKKILRFLAVTFIVSVVLFVAGNFFTHNWLSSFLFVVLPFIVISCLSNVWLLSAPLGVPDVKLNKEHICVCSADFSDENEIIPWSEVEKADIKLYEVIIYLTNGKQVSLNLNLYSDRSNKLLKKYLKSLPLSGTSDNA